MKDQTKIQLSTYEMELINNAEVILTKNAIMQKARLLLENLQQLQQEHIQSHRKKFPAEIFIPSPKISKGENYKGLPYLVLDHPRYFDKENILLIFPPDPIATMSRSWPRVSLLMKSRISSHIKSST